MSDLLLALDFGGTKHSLACLKLETARALVAGDTGHALAWQAHRRVFSPPGADAQYNLKTVFDLAHEILDGERPAAIGVSFGGPVDFRQGLVRLSHHVPGWENIPLQQMLEQSFQAPAAVDNDANVAALGEARFGAGRGASSLFYITVSTGVGGGWILNGQPWRGADGMAGEIGHTVVDPQGPPCLCGKSGCVERLASGPYMAADARQILQERPQRGTLIRQLASGDLDAITGKLLAEAAAAGDKLAWELLERSAHALEAEGEADADEFEGRMSSLLNRTANEESVDERYAAEPVRAAALVFFAAVPFAFLFIGYLRVAPEMRLRLRWMLVGIIAIMATVVINNAILEPSLLVQTINSSLYAFSIIAMAYALLRHRVVDFSIVMDRALVYGLVTTLVVGVVAAVKSLGIKVPVVVRLEGTKIALLGCPTSELLKRIEQIELDRTAHLFAAVDANCRVGKIRSRFAIPGPELDDVDLIAGRADERVAEFARQPARLQL